MTVKNAKKFIFKTFYDINDGDKMSKTYCNMGIKLTVSISALQSNKWPSLFKITPNEYSVKVKSDQCSVQPNPSLAEFSPTQPQLFYFYFHLPEFHDVHVELVLGTVSGPEKG